MPKASPRQVINIIKQIEEALWSEYRGYDKVLAYIERWQEISYEGWNNEDEVANFYIKFKKDKNGRDCIDLGRTLKDITNDELLFKIAVDIGVQIPDIIYAVPEIISLTANNYKDVNSVFENAFKKVYDDPSHAIALANSALETIIKRILKDIKPSYNKNDTLYTLAQNILKEFKIFPKDPGDISNIGSGLLKAAKHIESLRSNHTKEAHGKLQDDYIINDPLYAQFTINAVSTVGLFLLNFYEKKYKPQHENSDDEIPF